MTSIWIDCLGRNFEHALNLLEAAVRALPSAWSQSQVLGYIDHCRQRVRDTLSDVTDARAAIPLPTAHRHRGQPYAWIVTGLPGHIIKHSSQVRQFITAAGVHA